MDNRLARHSQNVNVRNSFISKTNITDIHNFNFKDYLNSLKLGRENL